METCGSSLSEDVELELDHERHTVKEEVNDSGEGHMLPAMKNRRTGSTSLLSPDVDSFMYCEECKLKYEGDCPVHRPLVYIDDAEVDGNMDRKLPGRETVEQTGLCGNYEEKSGVRFVKCSALHERRHTGEKSYKCDVCGVSFAHRGTLKAHKRRHTGEKPYMCEVCGVSFAYRNSLKVHIRIHTGKKPFLCDVCGVSFVCQNNLKVHKRTHTGEKPYMCDVCGVSFIQQGNLKTHQKKHIGEKSYKCDVCNASFFKFGYLKVHLWLHSGDNP